MLKALAINHYFSQDLDSLRYVAQGRIDLKVVSPAYFTVRADRYFPPAVYHGLEEYHRDTYRIARCRWAQKARQALYELYQLYQFDVVISPSDVFFYIRDVVHACREIGVPFIVLQKETTISPFSMEMECREIGRLYPFISDLMLVCSERHKQYWINSGASLEKIVVIGQPRFDFYRQPERWRNLRDFGLLLDEERPIILFLSYDQDAYAPVLSDVKPASYRPWARLRWETEEVLLDLVRAGKYNLIVKPHPQQNPADVRHLADHLQSLSGGDWQRRVVLVDGNFDTRHLIVNASVVVGFQTTALFEAMACGREVIYTYWTPQVEEFGDKLVPFHLYNHILKVARGPEDLREYLLTWEHASISIQVMSQRMEVFHEYLGTLDGCASERALEAIERFVRSYPQPGPQQAHMRYRLKSGRRRYLFKELIVAWCYRLLWLGALYLSYSLWWYRASSHYKHRLQIWAMQERKRLVECQAVLKGSTLGGEIIGRMWYPTFGEILKKLTQRLLQGRGQSAGAKNGGAQ